MSRILEIYTDGASKGNPGKAAIGVVVKEDGQVIKEVAQVIGDSTNNFAEYTALVVALKEAINLRADSVKIFSDSQLLCRQINGEYQVKSGNIVALFEEVQRLKKNFKQFVIINVPREQNKEADRLANKAIKEQAKMVAPSLNDGEESPSSRG